MLKRLTQGLFNPKPKTYTSVQALHKPPRVLRWALAGVVIGVFVALIIYAPARWLAYAVARLSKQQVLLTEAQGTIWSGSARLVLQGGQGSRDATTLPTRVQWQLQPIWLGAQVQLQSACCTTTPLQLRVHYQSSILQVAVDDAQVQLPAELLTGLGTPWNTLQLQGAFQLQTRNTVFVLAQQRSNFQGKLQIHLQQASTRLSTISPLGSYTVDIVGNREANTTALELTTQANSILQLQGQGQYTGGRWRFSGEAWTDTQHEAALNNLLNIIGQRNGARSIITLG